MDKILVGRQEWAWDQSSWPAGMIHASKAQELSIYVVFQNYFTWNNLVYWFVLVYGNLKAPSPASSVLHG